MNRRELIQLLLAFWLSSMALPVSLGMTQTDWASGTTPPNAWPNATGTGVPPGEVLKSHNGNLTINSPGAVFSNLAVQGMVYINAPNVTLKNCTVTVASFVVIKIADVRGVTIQNCTINGTGTGNEGSHGIQGTGTFLRNNIYNVENGITVDGTGPTVIRDNYIHDLLASGAPHYDGIQIDGGIANVTIEHNTIINRHIQTSAIMIDNYFGSISNITVDNNLLGGGSYTIYVDGQFNKHPISNVSITNNRMARGYFGITNFNRTRPTYKGNVHDGEVLVRSLSPQP